MKNLKTWMYFLLLPLLAGAAQCAAVAGGLYNLHDSPYATFIARKPGDLLTMIIQEQATEEDSGGQVSDRATNFSAQLNNAFFPHINLTKGLTATQGSGDPPQLAWSSDNSYKGVAQNKGDHSFVTTMQVQIVEEVNEGQFVIRGYRTVNLNGKSKKIMVSGVIRQRDITVNNTIQSFQVADAVVSIDGTTANEDVKPGFLNKLFNWVL